jgi:hypothetical protein
MPRGIPTAGFRNRSKNNDSSVKVAKIMQVLDQSLVAAPETDAEIDERISDRFEILQEMTDAALAGEARALIVSGPAGLGKSFTVEETLRKWDPKELRHTIVKGYVKATALYKLLYAHSQEGMVLVFDDADTIFFDDTSLNILKAACDSNKTRRVSYMTEGALYDDDTSDKLPKSFEFKGTIIFITNYDFDAMISKGHKLAPHLNAMISRAHYIDLAMKTKRDYMVRIRQVLKNGLLAQEGLNDVAQTEVISFIENNQNSMRELSLRMALKVAGIRKMGSARWEKIAKVTCCR